MKVFVNLEPLFEALADNIFYENKVNQTYAKYFSIIESLNMLSKNLNGWGSDFITYWRNSKFKEKNILKALAILRVHDDYVVIFLPRLVSSWMQIILKAWWLMLIRIIIR